MKSSLIVIGLTTLALSAMACSGAGTSPVSQSGANQEAAGADPYHPQALVGTWMWEQENTDNGTPSFSQLILGGQQDTLGNYPAGFTQQDYGTYSWGVQPCSMSTTCVNNGDYQLSLASNSSRNTTYEITLDNPEVMVIYIDSQHPFTFVLGH